ncbi:MAG: glycine cleavage system protein GcvH [Mariprofundaceae bacterium]
MSIPAELKYTREHEWLRCDGDTVVMGLSDHAQDALGDIVFVELPDVGRQVQVAEPCAVVESVKAVSDVYVPVAGEIVEVNTALETAPELVNSDPYGEGWLARISLADASQLNDLMDAEAYAGFISES